MAAVAVVPSPAVTSAPLYLIEDQLAALVETAELVLSAAAKRGTSLAGEREPAARLRYGLFGRASGPSKVCVRFLGGVQFGSQFLRPRRRLWEPNDGSRSMWGSALYQGSLPRAS